VADELLTSDFVDHEAPSGTSCGPEAARRTVRWLHAAFSGVRYEVDDAFAAGDRVVLRCRMLGQHTGSFLGLALTGRSLVEKQIHIFRLEGGQVAEHWACRDDLGMLHQLGASVSTQPA